MSNKKTYFIYADINCVCINGKEVWTPEEFIGTYHDAFGYGFNKYGKAFSVSEKKIINND